MDVSFERSNVKWINSSVSLAFLFPDEKDLTKVSPQLETLWKTLSKKQKEEALQSHEE